MPAAGQRLAKRPWLPIDCVNQKTLSEKELRLKTAKHARSALRRDPDADGFNFWLTKLNEFGGDFRQAEMVKAFLVSAEYRQRFGPP